jgi:thiamine-monophosphate kinase
MSVSDSNNGDSNSGDSNSDQPTPVDQIGEFRLIERLTQAFENPRSELVQSIGDDAAVWRFSEEQAWVLTTDGLFEGVHFDLAYCPLKHLGYKAAAVNFSDVYAMNARPVGLLVSLGFSNRFPAEALELIYKGIHAACEEYGAVLMGGDTNSSKQGLAITVTAIGEARPASITYRSGAREKDLLCVSGDLGAAFAGLQILEREKAVFQQNPEMQPDLSAYDYVIGRQLKPSARRNVIDFLAQQQLTPHAMIDLSDGLAADLAHLCYASGKGAVVYQDRLPMDPQMEEVARQFDQPITSYALYGGEDYELLFTLPATAYEQIKHEQHISAIGYMTEPAQGVQLVMEDGSMTELKPLGFDHFGPGEAPAGG